MDRFISTYQKDYTWPSTRIQHAPTTLRDGGSCRCDTRSRELKVIDLCGDDQDWSRLGPMGRLLDPKLYPAKTGPHPETEATKFDQPSTYMRKLEEKYPNLYGILQSTPMDEIIQRVDQDRFMTTYQMDYSDKAITGTTDEEKDPCVSMKHRIRIDCRPSTRSRLSKRDNGLRGRTKMSRKKVEDDSHETRIPPWRSEYQDSISRLGHAIMKGRIHHKKANAPAWRPPIEMDNRRKKYTATVPGNNWSREMRPNGARYTDSNTYPQDCASEHDVKFLGERTSEETVAEVEETGINKNNLHGYPDEPLYVPPRPSNNATLRGKHSRFNDCTESNVPDAMITMQKLQKLRELQMKRDMNERYYSHEIKRLIGEYYFGPKMASPTLRAHGKLQSASFQPHTEDRPRNSLEPCGTMTTITRLNCGCIQETTRPIFTTAKGRVQKRVCSQVEDEEQILKLISSNLQEHLISPLEQRKNRQKGKSKKQHYIDARTYAKNPPAGDQSFEMEEKRIDAEESEIPNRVSRSPSPREKFSNTSTTSN